MAQKQPAISSAPFVAVVGGVNVDIGGSSFGPLVPLDSNPGKVRTSLGGVGRNIAHNLRLLGLEVKLFTALGRDANAQLVANSCSGLGIDLSHAILVPEGRTSTYLYLTGPDGDLALAVSDMAICDEISPAYLAGHLDLLNQASVVVADTNIPQESLIFLAEHCTAPLFVDPVSTAKAEKLLPILGKLHTLKPNRYEARILSGMEISDDASFKQCADALLATGLKQVFISIGAEGMYAADQSHSLHLPCCRAEVVNTTGAGDATMAALVWAYLQQWELPQIARAGLAAGAVATESSETINPRMSQEAIRTLMAVTAK